jgi:hypothetical protein
MVQETTARRIILQRPGPEAPGFLRRQRAIMRFQHGLREIKRNDKNTDYCPDPHLIDDLVDFLLPSVVEPADRTVARELLLDLSQVEYEDVLAAYGGDDPKN